VLPIAQELEAVLGRSTVFYDEWYEHWLAGADADLLLQDLYGHQCDLVVVCVSGDYGSKPWTLTEHRAVRARLLRSSAVPADRHRILPIRVGAGDFDALLFNEIVPDVRSKSALDAAEMIIARLNLACADGGGARPVMARWPSDPPVMHWRMADHRAAHGAFARLLSEQSAARALLIRGMSETGKSHISRQMAGNAAQLPGVFYGRFDFKGTTNMNVEVESFCQPLGIEPPAGLDLNERLGRIFTELRRRAQPTLLVFDTYEAADEARAWIEGVLLPHLVAARWLRVVIIGQAVPVRAGTIWESLAAEPITLELPGPEDWLAYGQANHGESVDLRFVTQAHHFAKGKPSLLADLLGPRS
jgi:hypothetical protein